MSSKGSQRSVKNPRHIWEAARTLVTEQLWVAPQGPCVGESTQQILRHVMRLFLLASLLTCIPQSSCTWEAEPLKVGLLGFQEKSVFRVDVGCRTSVLVQVYMCWGVGQYVNGEELSPGHPSRGACVCACAHMYVLSPVAMHGSVGIVSVWSSRVSQDSSNDISSRRPSLASWLT